MTGTRTSRIVDLWISVVAPVVTVGAVIWLGAITGWPGWWVSLMPITVVAMVGYVAIARGMAGRRGNPPPRLLVVAMGVAVVAASAGTVAAAAVTLHSDQAITTDRAALRAISGEMICRLLTTGTDADRAAAGSVATGELADRLRSGSAAVESAAADTTTRCVPARVGLGAVTDADADVVVAANITERAGTQESAIGRVVAAHLQRVDGTWKVAALDVIR